MVLVGRGRGVGLLECGSRERGASAVSYVALLSLAAVMLATVTAVIPDTLGGGVKAAVCRVMGGDGCAPGARQSPAAKRAGGGGAEECRGNVLQLAYCHLALPYGRGVKGSWLGLRDVGVGAWESVTFVGCMVHLCSHQGFLDTWGGLKALVTTDPRETVPVIWDDTTKECHTWRNPQHSYRCMIGVGGAFIGFKGLNKIKALKAVKAAKRAKHAESPGKAPAPDHAPEHVPDVMSPSLRAVLGRIGEPSEVYLPGRAYELPYKSPPGVRVVEKGVPLDFKTLDVTKTYLWIVDPDGVFRFAPDQSPEYAITFPGRPNYTLKHGDLAAGARGADKTTPGNRPAARAGGELYAEWRSGRPTGRWIFDLNSSYAWSNTRTDGLWLGPDSLIAVEELLVMNGTTQWRIVLRGQDGPI